MSRDPLPTDPGPSGRAPDGEPTEVLRRLLAAFERGDPHAAAEALLRLAAPRLAGDLGGVAHAAHLFTNPAWAPLLRHRAARIGTPERIGDAARARVEVEAADGARVAYLASLRRAADGAADAAGDGAAEPGWRLTGLVREELADA